MHPHDLIARHRKHPKGIVEPQVFFGGEREVPQILQRLQVIGVDAGELALAPVTADVLIGMAEGPLQPLQLYGTQLVLAGALYSLQGWWSFAVLGRHRDGSSHYACASCNPP